MRYFITNVSLTDDCGEKVPKGTLIKFVKSKIVIVNNERVIPFGLSVNNYIMYPEVFIECDPTTALFKLVKS